MQVSHCQPRLADLYCPSIKQKRLCPDVRLPWTFSLQFFNFVCLISWDLLKIFCQNILHDKYLHNSNQFSIVEKCNGVLYCSLLLLLKIIQRNTLPGCYQKVPFIGLLRSMRAVWMKSQHIVRKTVNVLSTWNSISFLYFFMLLCV